MPETILQTIELTKTFTARRGPFGTKKVENVAVNRVSLEIEKGETLGLVGESGCGKSTLGLTIMRLYEADGGQVLFDGKDIIKANEKHLKPIRRQMQMIFQDPFASLDPRLTIEQILSEPLEIHQIGNQTERTETCRELLEKVGLSGEDLPRFPSQFSGGQQQRIVIARALALNPRLIICDEAVSSLDVSVQAQILNLLRDLQDEYGLSYLFISHNIAATAFMSRRIGVMYLGKLVEIGLTCQITSAPRHPYTRELLAAIPEPDPVNRETITNFKGETDEIIERPKGCVFYKHCPMAEEVCLKEEPQLREIEEHSQVACHFALES
jgi:oligopeptide transport system ATP-binding protein